MKAIYYFLLAVTIIGIAALVFFTNEPTPLKSFKSGQSHAEPRGPHQVGSLLPTPNASGHGALPHHSQTAGNQPMLSGAAATPSTPASQSSDALSALPNSEQKSLWKAFSEAQREIRPIPVSRDEREENQGYDFYSLHPKQNMTTRFGSQGIQIVSSDRTYTEEDAQNPSTSWQAQMRLLSLAGETVTQRVQPEKSEQSTSRVEYRHSAGLTEWFDNGVEGMEHGYTIAARPANLGEGEHVSLEIALDGLTAIPQQREDDAQVLSFMDGDREVLSYSKLLVFDARGRELPASMTTTETGFILAYHDEQAVYPVTVDPLIINEEAKLNRIDAAAADYFGISVTISGDSVVIGADGDDDGGADSGSAYVFTRSHGSWALQAKLTADDAAANDFFGSSVAISEDSVVIGAYKDDDGGTDSGSAYVFTRSGSSWVQQAKLTAGDAEAFDNFGYAVAISENSAVIGADIDDDGGSNSGSAYVFTRSRNSWTLHAKLTADDAAANDYFGSSVAISGDSVVIGANGDDDGGSSSGSAYVFTRSRGSWTQNAKLTAGDAAADDYFGCSVAISGDSVVIGAYQNDDGGSNSGSAYIFTRRGSSWTQNAKLTAGDAAASDSFGRAVAISGNSVVIGAYGDNDGGAASGSAYVFTRSIISWTQQAKLTADDAAASDHFGSSVAISGDSVVIGAYRNDDGGIDSGSAYVFTRSDNSWTQQTKLTAGDAAADDYFGHSVAISGDSVVIGASYDDVGGAAYVFTRSGSSWTQQAKLTADDAWFFDGFGRSVAISGDFVVIGVVGNYARRSAYVFTRSASSWTQQAKLTTRDAEPDDKFGHSVAISGNSVIIGAPGDGGIYSGSAYVFTWSGSSWTQQTKLTADDVVADGYFGHAVAISGDSVVIGAYRDDDGGIFSGSAYVFTRRGSSWTQQTKLTADDAAAEDVFGCSVAISGDSVVIGAYQNDDGDSNSGSAYVFTRSGSSWTQQAKLTADDAAAGDHFGTSVAISGDSVVIGADGDDDVGASTGSAYVFTRSGGSWVQQAKLTAGDAAAGDHFGTSVAISGDSVVIGADGDDDGGSDSGSVYIYRFSVPAMRELLVFDHSITELLTGTSVTSFPGQLLDTTEGFTFRLTNAGALGLDIQSVSLGGANSAQFSLTLPNISPVPDLASGESLDFTISFTPTGSSGFRNATVLITSNDSSTPVFTFTISGLGLSNVTDGDSDGMNDWAEYSMRVFGFDWQTSQTNLVSDYYAQAHTTGLYTPAQAAGVAGNMRVFNVDTMNNTVDIIIGLEESLNLNGFTPMTLNPAKLSVDGDGNILYRHDTTADKKFFRAGWKGQAAE